MLQTFLSNNICVRNITCAHDGRNSIIIHNKPNTAKKEQRATGGKKTPPFFSLSLSIQTNRCCIVLEAGFMLPSLMKQG